MSRAGKEEENRRRYLETRQLAIENGKEAAKRGISVREYVEEILGKVYDEELDVVVWMI